MIVNCIVQTGDLSKGKKGFITYHNVENPFTKFVDFLNSKYPNWLFFNVYRINQKNGYAGIYHNPNANHYQNEYNFNFPFLFMLPIGATFQFKGKKTRYTVVADYDNHGFVVYRSHVSNIEYTTNLNYRVENVTKKP